MRKRKRKKKRTLLKGLLITFAIIIFGLGAYGYSIYQSLNNAVTKMHSPLDRDQSEKREKSLQLNGAEPFSVLLLGVDTDEGKRGRTDSMVLLTVNGKEKSVQMLSIPRDMRTHIVGKGIDDKVNHAYAFGGVEMTLATVEEMLNVPIDYFIEIDMKGFKDMVNAVGGITVNNDMAFTVDANRFEKGTIHLNGDEALAFARMRKEDPRGDFGRQLRQREIISGIIDKGASVSSLWNYRDIFTALGNNIKTNLSFEEMVDIQKHYKDTRHQINQIEIEGNGQRINGIYYYIVSDEERRQLSEQLRNHLELAL